MSFDEYQGMTEKTDLGRRDEGVKLLLDPAFIEKVYGLSGETGEVLEKMKKLIRDKNGELTDKDKQEVAKELGDVLWYVAAIARYMEVPLSEVVKLNVEKMEGRLKRGTLSGSGDNR